MSVSAASASKQLKILKNIKWGNRNQVWPPTHTHNVITDSVSGPLSSAHTRPPDHTVINIKYDQHLLIKFNWLKSKIDKINHDQQREKEQRFAFKIKGRKYGIQAVVVNDGIKALWQETKHQVAGQCGCHGDLPPSTVRGTACWGRCRGRVWTERLGRRYLYRWVAAPLWSDRDCWTNPES